MKLLLLVVAALALLVGGARGAFVMKPVKEGKSVALVILQGASIPEDAYMPLAKELQAATDLALWVGLPHCGLNACEPLVVGGAIEGALKNLSAAGMPEGTPVVLAGHSLGGAFVQDWVASNANQVAAQILMGAFLKRQYRSAPYPVPTLTVGGDLDGLCRVTRLAEAYYHQIAHPSTSAAEAAKNFPVVVIPGMSHFQFASGDVPFLVREKDLEPELADEEAFKQISSTVAGFLAGQFGDADAGAAVLSAKLAATAPLLEPLIEALEQEAFPHFKPACNSDYPMPACPAYPRYPSKQQGDAPQTGCTCGTPWSVTAQRLMAGLPDYVTVASVDAVHSVSDVTPVHLPHIWSEPCADEKSGCVINVTTVTQPIYSSLDKLDTGFPYISASELRVKLKSRETMYMAAGRTDVDFHETDEAHSNCKPINEAAWAWALSKASPDALRRFKAIGEPYLFGEDTGPYNVGPLWIWNPLSYKEASGNSSVTISSPMQHTKHDYPIKQAAGYHYCKLLSPARALEWITVDSLRAKGSIKPKAAAAKTAMRGAPVSMDM